MNNSKKKILARGCDPGLSARAAVEFPKLLGGPTYIPTTSDDDFIQQLKATKFSVVYFAPGACRYSAAKMQLPGAISNTKTWTLEEYKSMVFELQGPDVIIVETPYESKSLEMLAKGLEVAREVK